MTDYPAKRSKKGGVIGHPPVKATMLFNALSGHGEVMVDTLFAAVFPEKKEEAKGWARTRRQQYLGPYITRLNRRLGERLQVVKPGKLRGSYTLTDL